MRSSLLFAVTLCGAAACSSSTDGTGGSGNPGGSSNNTPYSLSADSAFLDRTAPIGSALPTTVHVELGGQPAANVKVGWFPVKGSGSVSDSTSVTNANGDASVTWTLSDTARVNMLTATAGTGSVNLTATGTAGAATTLSKVSADSTALVAGASTLLTVRVVDAFGNRVAGVPVTWTADGGTLSVSAATTGSTGDAEVVFMTSNTAATYSVTASSPGLGSVSFKVVSF